MCSAVYIINDISDRKEDRKHKTKKNRPIVSGKITIKSALMLVVVLIILMIILNIYIASIRLSNSYWLTVLVFYRYLIMNVLYSLKLKRVAILDVAILAFGFVLRVIYEFLIRGIQISNWLYLTIFAFSFYTRLGKRRNELKKNGSESREVLKRYKHSFLDNNMYTYITMKIIFYSLWCIDINNLVESFINVGCTIPLVLIICMKYNLAIEKDSSRDPVEVILINKVLLTLCIIYAITMFAIIYI